MHLREFAYEDAPLPIAEGQTISQPYIVAFMVEALALKGGEKVLEIGAGSGYAAAVLSEIAGEVYTVERLGQLAEKAASTLADLGYDNVHVLHGDGTQGWPEHAPYRRHHRRGRRPEGSGIAEGAAQDRRPAGDPGRRAISACRSWSGSRGSREDEYQREDIADVRFVPLIGEEGWAARNASRRAPGRCSRLPGDRAKPGAADRAAPASRSTPSRRADLDPLLERIGDARVVLLGEATHGTSEFYRMRERITRELIAKKGFRFVAIEGDWPDAARIDHYVRHFEYPPSEWTAFARFPTWMWRNNEVRDFVDWLRAHNGRHEPSERVAFHGLDLYSLYNSIRVGAELSRRGRSRVRQGRARALWLPDAVAVRSRDLRPRGADRQLSDLRDRRWRAC